MSDPKVRLTPYRCPTCGSTEVRWAEYILSHRPILGTDGTRVFVSSDYTDNGECTTGEHLFCQECGWELLADATTPTAWPEIEHGYDDLVEVLEETGS